jgi:hypothetical protein
MDSRPFVPFRPINASDKAGPIHQAAIRAALANCYANRSNSSEKIKLNSALGVDLGRHFLLAGLALCCVPRGVVGITGLAADRRTTMDPWMCASLILAAGALGGVVNALITDNGFALPKVRRGIWCPGFVANLLVGAFAAFASWSFYGSGAGVELAAAAATGNKSA